MRVALTPARLNVNRQIVTGFAFADYAVDRCVGRDRFGVNRNNTITAVETGLIQRRAPQCLRLNFGFAWREADLFFAPPRLAGVSLAEHEPCRRNCARVIERLFACDMPVKE